MHMRAGESLLHSLQVDARSRGLVCRCEVGEMGRSAFKVQLEQACPENPLRGGVP